MREGGKISPEASLKIPDSILSPHPPPIEIEQIPIASIATSAPPLHSLPIIKPLQDLDLISSSELNAATDSSFTSHFDDDEDDFESYDDGEFEQKLTLVVSFQETSSRSEPRVKRGCCYRCTKGSWFTEKEACLVCDAKYCSSCILRAMGSMPEGRKCVGCIGSPIEGSKREKLRNGSRLLRNLLSSLEVEQVMKAERYCEANQLRAEDIYVNRQPMTQEEMVLLQSCECPPPRLKPRFYWYDKVSRFWGKEHESVRLTRRSSIDLEARNQDHVEDYAGVASRPRLIRNNIQLPDDVVQARERLLERLGSVSLTATREDEALRRSFNSDLQYLDFTPYNSKKSFGVSWEALCNLYLEVYRNSEEIGQITASQECCICLESFCEGDGLIRLRCGHRFHTMCLKPWVRTCSYCPYCRRNI